MMFDWAREVAAAFALFNSLSRYFALKQMTKQRRRHRSCNISIASDWLYSEDSLADRGSALQLCGGAFVLARLTSAYGVSGVFAFSMLPSLCRHAKKNIKKGVYNEPISQMFLLKFNRTKAVQR